jgi:hypothetical protein
VRAAAPQVQRQPLDGLGKVFAGDGARGVVNPEGERAFTVVQQPHRYVVAGFGLDDTMFDLWGHSAGGQFVHRFLVFKPQSLVRYAPNAAGTPH